MPKKKAKKKTSGTLKNNFGEFVHESALNAKLNEQKEEVKKEVTDVVNQELKDQKTELETKINEVKEIVPTSTGHETDTNLPWQQFGIIKMDIPTLDGAYKGVKLSAVDRFEVFNREEMDASLPQDADYAIVDHAKHFDNDKTNPNGKVVPIYNFNFSKLQELLSNEDLGAKEVKIPAFKVGQTPINEKYTDVTLSVKKKGAPLAQEQNYKFVVKKEALKGVKNPVIDLTSLIKPASELEK